MPESLSDKTPQEIVHVLAEQMRGLGRPRQEDDRPRISTGLAPLDRLLPCGGFAAGTLVEWIGTGRGSAAGTLALLTAREAAGTGGALVVVDRRRLFYPPTAAATGIDLAQLVLVRPEHEADEHWAIDQALRHPQVAAVLAWPEQLSPRTFRRMQLAAEHGGGLGLLIRPPQARREPSWADVRWLVHPQTTHRGWPLDVELLRCRGGPARGVAKVDLEEAER